MNVYLCSNHYSQWPFSIFIFNVSFKEGANHYACVTMGENFLKVACGEQLCIADQFNVQHRQLVERNRQILTKIPEVIILCGKQNIPIRGQSEEDSNFTAILRHHAQYSPLMAHHLAHANPCIKYTSPDVQNKLIRLCGLAIKDPLVKACNTSLFYRCIADEATYVATIEQIALSTRYLVRNDATLRLEITEEFLGFVEADKTTGEALAITFINDQEAYGVLVVKRCALTLSPLYRPKPPSAAPPHTARYRLHRSPLLPELDFDGFVTVL